MYNYIDPCTKEIKTIYADMSSPIMVSYYGQVKSFTYQQLQDGTFDSWMNQTYVTYKGVNPCQGLVTTTTTTTSTNLVSNTINLVMNLKRLERDGDRKRLLITEWRNWVRGHDSS